MEDRAAIFEPFFRSKAGAGAAEGYGLGLALVKKIAQRHGGEVNYRDAEEGGAIFEVRFPIVSKDL